MANICTTSTRRPLGEFPSTRSKPSQTASSFARKTRFISSATMGRTKELPTNLTIEFSRWELLSRPSAGKKPWILITALRLSSQTLKESLQLPQTPTKIPCLPSRPQDSSFKLPATSTTQILSSCMPIWEENFAGTTWLGRSTRTKSPVWTFASAKSCSWPVPRTNHCECGTMRRARTNAAFRSPRSVTLWRFTRPACTWSSLCKTRSGCWTF